MEYRPNSNPERRSADIPPESPVPQLCEHFAVKRAINLWQGPRHTGYNSLDQRIKSYRDKWSADSKSTPTALSEAGFFYSGECNLRYPTCVIHFTSTHNKYRTTSNYRFWRQDCLLSLLRRIARLVTVRRANARTCYLLSALRIRQVHQGANLYSGMP
jgi:hypothetical protein